MKLALHFRSIIAAFSQSLASEFDQLLSHINAWANQEHLPSGAHGNISVTSFTFGGTTQTTVGAAGSASAVPATPSGYITITIGTTEYVVPYYAQS